MPVSILLVTTSLSSASVTGVNPQAPPAAASHQPVQKKADKIVYEDGNLTVYAENVTLAELLQKVSAAVNVEIEIPNNAQNQIMDVVHFGPGPARDILAAMLSDANYDYLIQEAENNPDQLESVVIIPRKQPKNAPPAVNSPQLAQQRPGGRIIPRVIQPERAPVETPVVAVADTPAVAPNTPTVASAQNNTVPTPDSNLTPPGLPGTDLSTSAGTRTAFVQPAVSPVAVPQSLDPQSINSQLQQMYQQRVQQIQGQAQTSGR